MSNDALARLLHEIPLLRMWCDLIEARALEQLGKGETVPGYKLVAKRTVRKWLDEAKAAKWLTTKAGLSIDEVMPRAFVSPSQAETLLKIHKLGVEMLAQLTAKPAGDPTIAPANDPRPEITPFAEFNDDIMS